MKSLIRNIFKGKKGVLLLGLFICVVSYPVIMNKIVSKFGYDSLIVVESHSDYIFINEKEVALLNQYFELVQKTEEVKGKLSNISKITDVNRKAIGGYEARFIKKMCIHEVSQKRTKDDVKKFIGSCHHYISAFIKSLVVGSIWQSKLGQYKSVMCYKKYMITPEIFPIEFLAILKEYPKLKKLSIDNALYVMLKKKEDLCRV